MIWLVAAALAGPIEDGAAAFQAGKLPEATAIWEEAARSGPASAALATNLGRAAYEQGDLPRAIAWWRQAKRLAPRDPDVAHDLDFARAALGAVPAPAASPAPWTDGATTAEIGLLGVALSALASLAAVLARRRRSDATVALPIALVALAGLGLVVAATRAHLAWVAAPVGVVRAPAPLRDLPTLDAAGRDVLIPGTEVRVDGARDGFVRVHAGDGHEGWIVADQLWTIGPGHDPLTGSGPPAG